MNTELISGSDVTDIRDLAQTAVSPDLYEPGKQYVLSLVVPDGHQHILASLEGYAAAPYRKRGAVTLHTAEAFIDYTRAHNEGDRTAVYADVAARRVVAVLNGHEQEGDAAGWGDHRATLTLRHPLQTLAWLEHDGNMGSQSWFAEFLEDNLLDIVDPPGADLLELARSFRAQKSVNYRSSEVDESGDVQFLYEETTEAKAGQRGQIAVPESFTLALPLFEGMEPQTVTARLRYRIDPSGGALSLGYRLVRFEQFVRDAFDEVLAGIEDALEVTAYRGPAPDVVRPTR